MVDAIGLLPQFDFPPGSIDTFFVCLDSSVLLAICWLAHPGPLFRILDAYVVPFAGLLVRVPPR